jgi:predicted small lipoprotein YifL
MKRTLLLSALLAVALTACGRNEEAATPPATSSAPPAQSEPSAQPPANNPSAQQPATPPAEQKPEEKKQ